MYLQLLQAGYTSYTGRLGTVQFVNGVSQSQVDPNTAAGLAALFTVQWVSDQGVAASGSLTVASVPTAGETVVINGVTFTWQTTPAAPTDVAIGATAAACAANLALAIAAVAGSNPALAGATYAPNGATVNITYSIYGTAGNAFTLTNGTSGSAVTVSGATLTGGAAPTVVGPDDQTSPVNQFLGNGVDAVSAAVAEGVGLTTAQVIAAGIAAETPSTNENANTANEGESTEGFAENSPYQQPETPWTPTYTSTINTVTQAGIQSSRNPI